MEIFSRTERLIGKAGLERLAKARVAVFGIGGVGGYVVEALARSGVGALDLIDNDTVSESNINRQIIALHSTIGKRKTEVAAARVRDINPAIEVRVHNVFFLPETAASFDFSLYDYVVDAIDTVSGKIALIEKAKEANVPVISSMGTGNKLNPTAFEVADISKTSVCPLARVMRRELKKRSIGNVKVVYSKEEPKENSGGEPASIAFVPPVAGLIIAGEVIKDLIGGCD
ncbi:MAG: tRNA threonylcarbamoyladenosine dehydratase [Clostridia bacterium]|nr:tRNA threonylcarbamoyladenosine dehydratase [Clostridia bacterium]